jgi:hypothetical protein
MNTIEFDSVVEGGLIRIPEQYRSVVGHSVRVIVIPNEEAEVKEPEAEDAAKSVNALLGIIPNDFDLDEMRLERIMGKRPER